MSLHESKAGKWQEACQRLSTPLANLARKQIEAYCGLKHFESKEIKGFERRPILNGVGALKVGQAGHG
jgi:hypothetical protein